MISAADLTTTSCACVHFVDGEAVEVLAKELASTTLKVVGIGGTPVSSKHELLRQLANALDFPSLRRV